MLVVHVVCSATRQHHSKRYRCMDKSNREVYVSALIRHHHFRQSLQSGANVTSTLTTNMILHSQYDTWPKSLQGIGSAQPMHDMGSDVINGL